MQNVHINNQSNVTEINAVGGNIMSMQEMIQNKVAEAKKLAMENLYKNQGFVELKIKQSLQGEAFSALQNLISTCSALVAATPVYSQKRAQEYAFNGAKDYRFGEAINLIYQLVTGIKYSTMVHKPELLAATGLDALLVESVSEAFGQLPYYSTNHGIIIEGKKANAQDLKGQLALLGEALDIVIDTSSITQQAIDTSHTVALVKADTMLKEVALSAQMEEFVLR